MTVFASSGALDNGLVGLYRRGVNPQDSEIEPTGLH
jgi:hypothetical protein